MKRNTRAKTRKVSEPYEIYDHGSWQWRVLKHYQRADKERESRQYARVLCAVSSPMTYGDYDYGDVYCREIPGYNWHWDETDETSDYASAMMREIKEG